MCTSEPVGKLSGFHPWIQGKPWKRLFKLPQHVYTTKPRTMQAMIFSCDMLWEQKLNLEEIGKKEYWCLCLASKLPTLVLENGSFQKFSSRQTLICNKVWNHLKRFSCISQSYIIVGVSKAFWGGGQVENKGGEGIGRPWFLSWALTCMGCHL